MLTRTDRDCYRCHGTGDDEDSQLCRGCNGQGTVCREHSDPDCGECHVPR